MEIRRLGYFVRIADDGSLTRAAEFLRIAQPALSRQMRLLEEELGVTLFNRTARGMQLTEEGEYLRSAVAGPLRAMELALQNVRSFSARIEGNFAIGMPSSIGDQLAKSLVLRMSEAFPNVRLRIVEGITGSLIDWLNRGMIDFALLEEASRDERLLNRELFSQPLLLVGPRKGSGIKGATVPFDKVVTLPLIVPTHHLGIRARIDDALTKSRRVANVCLEADSCHLIKTLIEAGAGFSLLPRFYCSEELQRRQLQSWTISEAELTVSFYLSYRKSHGVAANGVEAKVIETIVGLMQQLGRQVVSKRS